MKHDIRKQQLEELLALPEIEREMLMWQTLQFKNYIEEKYPVMPGKDNKRYSEWHFDMNTLQGACMIYREMFGSNVLDDYRNLTRCETETYRREEK